MRIKLDQNTTIADVQRLLSNESADAKLLAKKDSRGNTVIYTRADKELTGFGGTVSKIKDRFLSNFGLDKESVAKKEVAKFVKELAARTKTSLDAKADQAGTGHAAVLKLNQAIDHIGQMLGKQSQSVGNLSEVLTGIEILTESVTSVFVNKISQKDNLPEVPRTTNKSMGRGNVEWDTNRNEVTVDDLHINGKKFVMKEALGAGGNGSVFLYVSEDQDRVAVKIPVNSLAKKKGGLEESNAKMLREQANTLRLLDQNKSVTGFTDHVVMSNGLIALVGEVMPNGDLATLGERMDTALFEGDSQKIPSGRIGNLERKLMGLTLLQDSAIGLVSLIETKGVSHGDMKSQNVMIDTNGKAVIIDLGESASTDSMKPQNYKFPQNPLYRAPETANLISKQEERHNVVVNTNKEMFSLLLGKVMEHIELDTGKIGEAKLKQLSKSLQDFGSGVASSLQDLVELKNNSDMNISATFDTFGLGTLGYELLIGGRASAELENKSDSVSDLYEGRYYTLHTR